MTQNKKKAAAAAGAREHIPLGLSQQGILCIDPGISGKGTTGWAYFRNLRNQEGVRPMLRVDNCGLLEAESASLPWQERALQIASRFSVLIDDLKRIENVDFCYIEFPQFFGNDATSLAASNRGDLLKLAFLVGALADAAAAQGIEFIPLSPSEWKGQLPKKVVALRVYNATGKHFAEHIEDAVGIACFLERRL